MGNIIGSNIFNVAVILGISAMICPLTVHLKIVRIDMPLMLAASALFTVLLMTGGGLLRWEGGVLVAGLLAYTSWSLIEGRRESSAALFAADAQTNSPPQSAASAPLLLSIVLILASLVLLVFGARLLVVNAIVIARHLGVNETVIGLTIVAAGTSLPELATSLLAAFRRQTDIAIGNIVGSNLFNLLGIAGTAALVTPIRPEGIKWLDLGFMLATSLILLPLMRTGFRLVRWEGAVLLASYLLYLWLVWPK
jgi:cation:H+ antiporter